jgi:hypothetical protein
MNKQQTDHIGETNKMVTALNKWLAKQKRFELIRLSRNFQRQNK